MPAWRIYYGGGVTFSSEEGSSRAAPALNVQVIKQRNEDGRSMIHSHDYYWHEDGEWYGGDLFGLFDYLVRSGLIKFGRSVPHPAYREAMERAQQDSEV